MALRDQPYLPLYVQDFLNDERLLECSAAATGVYIRLMCLMHKPENYGKIDIKSRDLSLFGGTQPLEQFASQLARHMPYDKNEILKALKELVSEGVIYVEGKSLCQKRMIRDSEISEKRAEAGRRGSSITNKIFAASNDAAKQAKQAKQAKPKSEVKHKYADTVRLLDTEYQKLVTDYGEEGTKRLIELLDNYKAATGRTYKSDYRAILNWVVDKYESEQRKKGSGNLSPKNVNDIWK